MNIPFVDNNNWPFTLTNDVYLVFPKDMMFINSFGEYVNMLTMTEEDYKNVAMGRTLLKVEYVI